MTVRTSSLSRETAETSVQLILNIDGAGCSDISTGIGFLDHVLDTMVKHGRFDLKLSCRGDLEVDDHHTAEDCAIVLGSAFRTAFGNGRGIRRFGSAFAPLDEALSRAIVDISGRGNACIDLGLSRETLGRLACENVPHFLRSFAVSAGITLHVDVLKGENDHHRAESAFKSVGLALRQALMKSGFDDVASTKKSLDLPVLQDTGKELPGGVS
jgi:imidazoleglycerol-phosphate dehydratase